MAGQKLTLNTVFADTSLPVYKDDPVLSLGSLILIDPSHSLAPWAAGVPANGSTVKNLVGARAQILCAAPSLASVDLGVGYSATLTGNKGKMERTPKGGLHGIYSQTTTTYAAEAADNSQYTINIPDEIRQYMIDNPNNDIVMSLWHRITRANTHGGGTAHWATVHNSSVPGTNFHTIFDQIAKSHPNEIGKSATGPINEVGPAIRRNRAVTSWAGTAPTVTGGMWAMAYILGNVALNASTNAARGTSGSHVLYRFYMEDLTVSGRTYAQYDELDQKAFAAAFGMGGRYYNDTIPTAPSTIP